VCGGLVRLLFHPAVLPFHNSQFSRCHDRCFAVGDRLAVSQLAVRTRRLKVVAITVAGYLAQLHETAALAQSAGSPQAVVDHVKEQLGGLLGLAECRFEFGSLLSHPPGLRPDGSVADGHDRWDVERTGLPAELELRVMGNGQYYGRFMMRPGPGAKPSLQARLIAVSPAGLAARAFGAHEPARSTS
jgi:hypothetical protein